MGAITGGAGPIAALGRLLADALLPPQCLACGAAVDGVGRLCAACWAGVGFIAPPVCAACGLPFDFAIEPGALCGACAAAAPVYHRARAVMRYDDGSRELVLGFKHGDRTEAAPAYGRWLARAGAELLAETDLIVPVPLHRWRLLRRRYNQSALLALALGRACRRPAAVDLMARVKATPSQAGLGAAARHANLRGAFSVRAKWRDILRDKRVLLIDDVMTTGATVEAAARVLGRAGAARVEVLTLARVVRPTVRVI